LPALDQEPEFTADLVDAGSRPQGETLIGAAIASLGRRGSFTDRWKAIFDFHQQGAEWGLVALDQGVDGEPLLGAVEQALNGTTFEFAAAPAASPTTTAPGAGNTTTTSPPPGTPPPTTPPPTSPPPTTPPAGGPLPTTGIGIIDNAVAPVNDLIGGLLGG
jgi:hypothetical protein